MSLFPRVKHYHTEPKAEYITTYKYILDSAQHLLIGGTTGSGKSVLINGLITTAITTGTPAHYQFILIDPKRVELRQYEKVSDFCICRATSTGQIIAALNRAVEIMNRRYADMEKRKIKTFDGIRIYIVIDELGDLLTNGAQTRTEATAIRKSLQHLLQLGRAANIYIIAATQSPSRKTIPAEHQVNYTDRIALRCQSAIESRQIIGIPGAENLPQYGIVLYRCQKNRDVVKIEIPQLSNDFIRARCAWWATKAARKKT